MSRRRLFSSDEIINALLRGGFEIVRKSKGSHQALIRQRTDGGHDTTVVILHKPEVPKGTFDSILALGNVDYDDFLDWAKVKRKGRKRKKAGEA